MASVFLAMVAIGFEPVKAEYVSSEPIYIRADGTIEPSNAPIATVDRITYRFTGDILGNNLPSVVYVEINNAVLDGTGHKIYSTSPNNKFPLLPSDSIGISLNGNGGNVTIKNFEIMGFGYGITTGITANPYTINDKILGNLLADNYFGISLISPGRNNEITENQIVNNQIGLSIQWSGYNSVSKNKIENNAQGMILGLNSSYNRILENTIENNGWGFEEGFAVKIFPILSGNPPTIYNLFYHNDFTNNSVQITGPYSIVPIPPNSTNYWDNEFASGGNYWSDYVGTDLHSGPFQNETCNDGIGDTPYIISENNRDNYPLVKPWQEHLNPPVARFQYSPQSGYALQELAFNSSLSYDLDGNIASYSWNFDDGNTTITNSTVINHAFSVPGDYSVTLNVFDESGLSNSYLQTVHVIAYSIISISATLVATNAGYKVTINGALQDMFRNPLSKEMMVVSYTFEGAGNWFPLTSVKTDDSGKFERTWFLNSTGQFTVRAIWAGNSTINPAQNTTVLYAGINNYPSPSVSAPENPNLVGIALIFSIVSLILIYFGRRRMKTRSPPMSIV
jgi:parallel beta-helix repeat protein